MRKALSTAIAFAFAAGMAVPAAMAAQSQKQMDMRAKPVTLAALPGPVEREALKTWPKMADMTPLAWKLNNGDYRIVVHPTSTQSKSIVIAPDGMAQKG